ncbi:H-type lectin domain-containing protein [Thalassovita sp.]|uniref:H-type lectin domain-containing protein n=1 Tax=Thalassovita sp. TaxID=1979401 RepID=UPI002B26C0BD|nr:H-type lectin domain-containing protein [Thalassovita sp.]
MKRIRSNLTGIDQGDVVLFTDFEDGGEMWTGEGNRERRKKVTFSEPFKSPPAVTCSVSLWDVDYSTNIRSDVYALDITEKDFDIVFNTWDNTRIARIRVSWMAIGELSDEDDWDIP